VHRILNLTHHLSIQQPRGSNIFGPGDYSPDDSLSIFTLNYANGAGFSDHFHASGGRVDPNTLNYDKIDFRHPATAPLEDETHAGEDVGVYADGPWAHLFTGVYEQNYIAHGMMYATCLGPNDRLYSEQCQAYRNKGVENRVNIVLWLACTIILVNFI
jgi:alkaline phosphatase